MCRVHSILANGNGSFLPPARRVWWVVPICPHPPRPRHNIKGIYADTVNNMPLHRGQERMRAVETPRLSIVMPTCGISSALHRYVRDVLTRRISVRLLVISSNSASSAPTVYSTLTTRRAYVQIVRRTGRNLSTTEGANVTDTLNSIVAFISDSS